MSLENPKSLDEWLEKKTLEIKKDAEERRIKLIEQIAKGYAAGLAIINEAEHKLLEGVKKRYNDLKK